MSDFSISALQSMLEPYVIGWTGDFYFFGNSATGYVFAVLIVFVLSLVFLVFKRIIIGWLYILSRKTNNGYDDMLVEMIKVVRLRFYGFLSLYIGLKTLVISSWIEACIEAVLIFWVVALVIRASETAFDFYVEVTFGEIDQSDERAMVGAIETVSIFGKIILWAFGLILILSNLGVNVTSLLAGVGIGGIAIALAVQNILGDVFSSFSLLFDKPFQVGDYIEFNDIAGTVQHIGLKTTRLRALEGEEIVVPNNALVSGEVHNYKKLKRRRVRFVLGVTYETGIQKLHEIPDLIASIFDGRKDITLYNASLKEMGDSALQYVVIYYVESDDYLEYLRLNQEVLLTIKHVFGKKKIDFAYPTLTIKN